MTDGFEVIGRVYFDRDCDRWVYKPTEGYLNLNKLDEIAKKMSGIVKNEPDPTGRKDTFEQWGR